MQGQWDHPQAYLADLLSKLVNLSPATRLDELLPWAWRAGQSDHCLAAGGSMTRTNATAVRPAIFVSPAPPKISMSPLELDGYLTGIVVTPQPIPILPGRWIALLWDDEPVFDDDLQIKFVLGPVIRQGGQTRLRPVSEALRGIPAGRPAASSPALHDTPRRWPAASAIVTLRNRLMPLDDPMANDEHVALLKQGVAAWNKWREENPKIRPDLSKADLKEAYLPGANLSRARLSHANLSEANLGGANLGGADLFQADLSNASLRGATLRDAQLVNADLIGANLSGADLREANLCTTNLCKAILRGASLGIALLLDTDLTGADLTGCWVYGISTWGLKLDGAKQQNLIIAHANEPTITVDNIEVAQFIYLMLNNQKVRDVIDTITSKAVLILGRFTEERKVVLDALREELRKRNYLPILFDFEIPARQNIIETVTLLARMARFIIADLTDPSSIPQELQAIIPSVRVPVQPLLLEGSSLYSMFKDFDPQDFHWVLPVYRYKEPEQLLATLAVNVIAPAEAKVKAFEERRRMIEAELTKP